MRFAHLADCHIGSWRDPKLKDAAIKAFSKAVDICVSEKLNFVLIAGDLFNTSLPSVDSLKSTVMKLKQLKDNNIPVYVIAGSHDFSPSGKTMLDVLEQAGLLVNVAKGEVINNQLRLNFTIDKKTSTKLTGLLGKKGGLEKEFYESLITDNLDEPGFKIFLFHSLLSEFKPKDLEKVDSSPLSLLPKNFNYYAGGHPHFVFNRQEPDYGTIAYPGPLFPNNFKELEDLERGGFYIVNVENNNIKLDWQPVQVHNLFKINIDADNKSPEQVTNEIQEIIKPKEFNNTIITIRLSGVLSCGRPSDIDFKDIFDRLYKKSAFFVMKNTNKLSSKEFEEIMIQKTSSVDQLENNLIMEHLQQVKVSGLDNDKEESLIKNLMFSLASEKAEGETVATFESRIKQDVERIISL